MTTAFLTDERCFWHGGGAYALTMPVGGPMVLAPLIVWWSSKRSRSSAFLTPVEWQPAAVMKLQHLILSRWQGMEAPEEHRDQHGPGQAVTHA